MIIPNPKFFAIVEQAIAAGRSVEILVRGDSMRPALRDGVHRVELVPWRGERLRVGMIALIRYRGRHVLHRLVAIGASDELVFRGDNLPHTVERVCRGDIVGIVGRVIGPSGEIDCGGWRFRICSRIAAVTARPMALLRARVAGLRVRLAGVRPGPETGKTRVLFFIESLAGGGAEKVLATIAEQIDRSRFEITVCTVTSAGVHVGAVRRAARHVPMIRTRNRLLYSLLYHLIYYVLPARLVGRWFLPRGCDVAVAFCEGFATRIVARVGARRAATGAARGAVRRIAWVHTDPVTNPWTQGTVYRSIGRERAAYARFDEVVCVSRSVREAFEGRFGLPARTLYNPLDGEAIVRRSLEVPAGLPAGLTAGLPAKKRLRMVSTGRLVPQKGYDRLLAVAARLRDEGCDFELWILGEGPLRGEIEALISRHRLGDRVTLWGFVANPYPMVASADVFVCSSRSEGYSTAATEAIVLGVPVVTTRVAGMEELLGRVAADTGGAQEAGEGSGGGAPGTSGKAGAGACGIIVENSDEALFAPLSRIARDPASLEQLRRNARKRGKDFTLAATLAPIENLLENPLTKP